MASPSSEPQQLSKKDSDRLVAFVLEKWQTAKADRWRAERQWYMNLAFYAGKQNIIAQDTPGSSRQFKLWTPPAPYYRARPVINRIRPLMRTEMAKLTKQKPTAYIIPSSDDDDDVMAAKAGEKVWEAQYRNNKLAGVFRRAIFWVSLCGNGFIKTWWDPDCFDETTQAKGKLCYESITPFHLFFPDLETVDIEDQPYFIHGSVKGLEGLQMMYSSQLVQNGGQSASALDETFKQVMGIDSNSKNAKIKEVLVREMWIKPGVSKVVPNGGIITLAGDKLLSFWDGMPYDHKQFPVAHIRHVETGKFYGGSVIEDLISLQKELNRTRGQLVEAKNRMAKPQLAAEQGSVDPSKITSEPGQVILYRPGFNAPTPIPLQGIPSYVENELIRIKQDMDDIAGQHEVSRGGVPTGIHAAAAIQFLSEADQTQLGYTFSSIEEATEKVAGQTLKLVKQYWDTPRTIRLVDDDSSFDVQQLMGKDLGENTDIRVESGSAMPLSLAAKQSLIMDLMKFGFVPPDKGLEVMDMGGLSKLYDDLQVDSNQIKRENVLMSQIDDAMAQMYLQQFQAQTMQAMQMGALTADPATGQPIDPNTGQPPVAPPMVPVNTWDNHMLHIQKHNNYRKTQEFLTLSDTVKQEFEKHVQGHMVAYAQDLADPIRASIVQGTQPPMMPPGGPQQGQPNQFQGQGQ